MQTKVPVQLLTARVIAERIGVPIHRVRRILETRQDIKPAAMAGRTRLYNAAALARVRYELSVIDARRSR